ncbi:TerB family tellurite resistance protein [uncultured Oscillibacter sp.]|uniref:tellurite resistance TerB family protein n=1 Tax=uncultured Oscillibacter sp. TaxID=876091 RepID=UPI0025F3D8A3|nr:TerB family tellurite resistance protein [uncultured Oscillibacter sp.]
MKQVQKIAYVKALMYIAAADENVDETERQQFTQLGDLYGLTDSEISQVADSVIKKEESLESILGNITDRSTQLLLMYDLMAICYVDNNYSLAEKNNMRTITRIMGIEEAKLIEMESVMEESVTLHKKINSILEKQGDAQNENW